MSLNNHAYELENFDSLYQNHVNYVKVFKTFIKLYICDKIHNKVSGDVT